MDKLLVASLAICLSATACRTVNVQPESVSMLYEKIDTVEKEAVELVSVSEELPPSPQANVVQEAVKKHAETVKTLVAITEEAKIETVTMAKQSIELKTENKILKKDLFTFRILSLVGLIAGLAVSLFVFRSRQTPGSSSG